MLRSLFLIPTLSIHGILWAQLEILPPAYPQPLPSPQYQGQDDFSELEVDLPSPQDVANEQTVLVAGVPVPWSVKQAFLDACRGKFDAQTCEELAIRGCLQVAHTYENPPVQVQTVQRTIPIVLKVHVNQHTIHRRQTQYVDNYDVQIHEVVRNTHETRICPPTYTVGRINVRHCTTQQPTSVYCPPVPQIVTQGCYTRQIYVDPVASQHFFASSIPAAYIDPFQLQGLIQQHTHFRNVVIQQSQTGYLQFHCIAPFHVQQLEQRFTNSFHQLGVSANHRLTMAERLRLRTQFHQDVNQFMRTLRQNQR